ncbi:class I SAM-dependent methyltransferase [Campylobacter mucosalis]|uniref:SAM-dependent methyltransferase n=1 Tax=Campylobacter mucosalis CCUG 21559 TaxID=1032067 RepID=A0A6G5QEY8_9BACT|nr:class I SAM-dependent methyltransferase [Campylobacter mucosalis]QCD44255.1 SAM-dependent methyltransferase [Campylobacter mucosalis CCUG 21559]
MQDIQESYDKLPYFSNVFVETSPFRLEAIGKFLTLNPAKAYNARVLEIGCSYGGNLLPFAAQNPNAKILGIDLSQTQIQTANELADKMGLKNIKFMQKDICELSPQDVKEFEKFDYILCHGVYSWVPDFVRDAILKVIKNFLDPNGIAYISYNTYPGWKTKEVIREFLKFGTQNSNTPTQKCKKANELLDTFGLYLEFMEQNETDVPHLQALNRYIKDLNGRSDTYIFHEFLESFNRPLWFKEFAQALDQNGLSYLTDTNLDDIFHQNVGIKEFDDWVDINFTDRIEKEQALDFFTNKTFRKSLVVHKESMGGGSGEFHAEIGVNELSLINLSTTFKKQSDGSYKSINDKSMKPEYNWLYDVFNKVCPESINFASLASLLDNENAVQTAYLGFLEILGKDCAILSTFKTENIKYEVGKTRLKENLRGYFQYFANNKKPVIGFSNMFNVKVKFSHIDAAMALNFDGKKSIDDIVTIAGNLLKTNKLTLSVYETNVKPSDKKESKKLLLEYVKNIEAMLSDNYFLENFS